ncbi:MerR family transcriptional regulator [Allorhizobium undicola]|uniref:MerR family transcriptional regulator n=1 Tax=Allorhizobium undicola TaxID=78527 RepID=UPI0004841C6A|nr:helix-turn-helix domain-containing protein [Allorhizobium undicola]
MRNFSIGELSRQSGIKITTIRYYEEIGLLPPAIRRENGRRAYDENDATRLTFIRHARELGFDVADIREMIAMAAEPERPCGRLDAIARKHLAAVEARIERLLTLKAELQAMLHAAPHGRVGDCGILHALSDTSHDHGRLLDG